MRENHAINFLKAKLEEMKENERKWIHDDSYKGVMLCREAIEDIKDALETLGVTVD